MWNEEESRKNFEAAKQLVVPGSLKSPLLMHPLAEDAGGDFFHSGGKHFSSQNRSRVDDVEGLGHGTDGQHQQIGTATDKEQGSTR